MPFPTHSTTTDERSPTAPPAFSVSPLPRKSVTCRRSGSNRSPSSWNFTVKVPVRGKGLARSWPICRICAWNEVQGGVEAHLVEHPDGDGSEHFVLCRSSLADLFLESGPLAIARVMDERQGSRQPGGKTCRSRLDHPLHGCRRAGQTGREHKIDLRLRTVTKPDEDVVVILAHLGLKLPKGSKLVQNVVEKNASFVS